MADNVFLSNATSPNWTTAGSWSTGSAPVNGDIVFLTNNNTLLTLGLNNSTVALTSLNMVMDFTGQLGVNGSSNQYLQIAATTGNIGLASAGGQIGSGSTVFNWDAGTSSTVVNILTSSNGGSVGNAPIKIKGTALTINQVGGIFSVAALASETATVNTLTVTSSAQGVSPQAWVGPQCNMKTLTMSSGAVYDSSQQVTTSASLSRSGTLLTYTGTGGFATLEVDAGAAVRYNGSGSVNSVILTGSIDLSGGGGAVTFGNTTLYRGAIINDPLGRLVFTNPPTIVGCSRTEVSINLGVGRYV